jgi:hypothetical protein
MYFFVLLFFLVLGAFLGKANEPILLDSSFLSLYIGQSSYLEFEDIYKTISLSFKMEGDDKTPIEELCTVNYFFARKTFLKFKMSLYVLQKFIIFYFRPSEKRGRQISHFLFFSQHPKHMT